MAPGVWRKLLGQIHFLPRSFFLSSWSNASQECCSFQKIFLILWCRATCTVADKHIESVFVSPIMGMWKFSELREKRIALISCIVMWLCTTLVHTPPYYPSVGHCIVCFSSGLSTTSIMIDENQIHTFFLYITHRCWSCYGNKKIELRISKFILL